MYLGGQTPAAFCCFLQPQGGHRGIFASRGRRSTSRGSRKSLAPRPAKSVRKGAEGDPSAEITSTCSLFPMATEAWACVKKSNPPSEWSTFGWVCLLIGQVSGCPVLTHRGQIIIDIWLLRVWLHFARYSTPYSFFRPAVPCLRLAGLSSLGLLTQ